MNQNELKPQKYQKSQSKSIKTHQKSIAPQTVAPQTVAPLKNLKNLKNGPSDLLINKVQKKILKKHDFKNGKKI